MMTKAWWKSWKEFLGIIVVLVVLGDLKGCIFPDHPAPVALEADGKSYIACNSPDISRGLFHLSSTYSVDFEDNNGSTVSLRGVEKLLITNLPQKIDAPFPSNPAPPVGKDKNGKPYGDGDIYTWGDGTTAQLKNGVWVPVKIKNRVCESDNDREKREAREQEERRVEEKRLAAEEEIRQKAATVKLAQTCKEWEDKHPIGTPVDVSTGKADNGMSVEIMVDSPEGCTGPLETAYNEKLLQAQTPSAPSKKKSTNPAAPHWATIIGDYGPKIYKRCYFNVDPGASCGYLDADQVVASLHKGDRVRVLSGKIRSSDGSEIYEVKFQSWTGWVSATDVTLE
jgi:hypothetical protein